MNASGRLDLQVAARGLARSRSAAAALIRAGAVRVDGTVVSKPGTVVDAGAELTVDGGPQWVSRAAGKLAGALDALALPVAGRGLDAGASTGGFTQVLLERGCERVYAVDVGHDQLATALRGDPRVTNHEGLHLRDLQLSHLGGRTVDLAVADVSFISLSKVLAPILSAVKPTGWVLTLVKPQFEVGPAGRDRHGVVTDPQLRDQAVEGISRAARQLGWRPQTVLASPVVGQAGNQEYLLHLAGPQAS